MLGKQELGLSATIAGLVGDLACGEIYIIRAASKTNPFSNSPKDYQIIHQSPVMSVDQLSAENSRRLFGEADRVYYSCAVVTPDPPSLLDTGAFVIIKSELQTIRGSLARADHELSGITALYVNGSEKLPAGVNSLIL